MLTTLVFGAIGTLVETSELQRQAFNEAFAEAGLGWIWGVELYQQLLTTPGGSRRVQLFAQQQGLELSQARITWVHERKSAIYQATLGTGGVALRPGVARLVHEALDNDLHVALASGTSAANIKAITDAVGDALPIRDFAVVIDSGSDADPKPAPDIYDECLRTLGAQADEVVAVEDTTISLAAAVAAGVVTLATPGAYVAHQDFSAATAVLADLDSAEALRSPIPVPPTGINVAWLRELVDARVSR